MPPKGKPLPPDHQAALAAGVAAAKQQPQSPEPSPTPAPPSPGEPGTDDSLIAGDHTDLFAAHSHEVDQAIMDMVRGVRVAMQVKKVKLLRGEAEYEVETEAGETWFVYLKPPVTSLLKFAREQVRGKAQAKDAQAKAGTVIVKIAIPGHDHEVDSYLASLSYDQLAKLHLDPDTLAKVQAAQG